MVNLEARLDKAEQMIRMPSFRQNKGLGNEVGYYVFDYPAERELTVRERKIGGMEFYDVNFSYIDNETFNEEFVPVPEQGGGKLIPEGMGKPGHIYTVSHGKSGMIGVYNLQVRNADDWRNR